MSAERTEQQRNRANSFNVCHECKSVFDPPDSSSVVCGACRTEQASGGERELSNRPANRPVCKYCGTSCFAWVPCKERLAAGKAKRGAAKVIPNTEVEILAANEIKQAMIDGKIGYDIAETEQVIIDILRTRYGQLYIDLEYYEQRLESEQSK